MIEATNLMQGLGNFYCECGDSLRPKRISDDTIEYYCPSCDVTYRVEKAEHGKGRE